MIRELGNVELFGLCETRPKVQCSHCLLFWNQGILYCICGQFLVDSESRRKFHKLRLDALSIPNYVIKKGRSHGARHGKTEEQKEYHIAWNAWKRCCKKVDSQGGHFTGIHDRVPRDPVYCESQLAIGWTEQKCEELDELAKEDHTYHLSPEEFRRYQGQWYITLNRSGKNVPMKLRSDFRTVVSMKNRLHHESGQQVEELIHPDQYRIWHPSSSTSWWDKSESNWKRAHKNFSWFRLQSMAIHCNRRGVDRYTSHVIFLLQFAHVITCRSHCMALNEPPNVSVCALHSIFMPSTMCV